MPDKDIPAQLEQSGYRLALITENSYIKSYS